MARLIDADAYKKHLCENCIDKLIWGERFCPCGRVLGVDLFPTAYDVDRVVEALENEKTKKNDTIALCDAEVNGIIDLVIDIVERGGIDG